MIGFALGFAACWYLRPRITEFWNNFIGKKK
jgi:hypothetical protein